MPEPPPSEGASDAVPPADQIPPGSYLSPQLTLPQRWDELLAFLRGARGLTILSGMLARGGFYHRHSPVAAEQLRRKCVLELLDLIAAALIADGRDGRFGNLPGRDITGRKEAAAMLERAVYVRRLTPQLVRTDETLSGCVDAVMSSGPARVALADLQEAVLSGEETPEVGRGCRPGVEISLAQGRDPMPALAPGVSGISADMPADLADALRAARELMGVADQLVTCGEFGSRGERGFDEALFNTLRARMADGPDRREAITKVQTELISVSDLGACFGASCAHRAAVKWYERVLCALIVPNTDFQMWCTLCVHTLNDRLDSSAIGAACEREAYLAFAARTRAAQPAAVPTVAPGRAERVEGEVASEDINAVALLTRYVAEQFRDGQLYAPYMKLRAVLVNAGCDDYRKANELTDKAMNELYRRGFVAPAVDPTHRWKWPVDWQILPAAVSQPQPAGVTSANATPADAGQNQPSNPLEQRANVLGTIVQGIDHQRQAEQSAQRIALELLARRLIGAPRRWPELNHRPTRRRLLSNRERKSKQ